MAAPASEYRHTHRPLQNISKSGFCSSMFWGQTCSLTACADTPLSQARAGATRHRPKAPGTGRKAKSLTQVQDGVTSDTLEKNLSLLSQLQTQERSVCTQHSLAGDRATTPPRARGPPEANPVPRKALAKRPSGPSPTSTVFCLVFCFRATPSAQGSSQVRS